MAAPDLSELLSTPSAEAINQYLELMEDTESPRVYHIWSLLATAAALIGQNARLKLGAMHSVKANMFVVLVGPPAVKKSTSINYIESIAQGTTLNHGPTDTGGQRHGLMSAMIGLHRGDGRQRRVGLESPLNQQTMYPRRSADMVLFSPELGRLWGSSNREMADFFVDLYDGELLDYETKASTTRIKEPLVTLLGATTPSSLASMLPENAATHGVLSRIIFVHADSVYKFVPSPPDPTEEWYDKRDAVAARLRWIDGNRRDFILHPAGRSAYESLYEYHAETQDPRLESYQGRRNGTHLLKVAMSITALRCDTLILDSDIYLAHELLKQIEPVMHKALESFGRNKAYNARSTIIQFLKSRGGRAPMSDVLAAAAADLNQREAQEVLLSMSTHGEITIYGSMVILGSVQKAKGGS